MLHFFAIGFSSGLGMIIPALGDAYDTTGLPTGVAGWEV